VTIRVLLADDHVLLREGLRLIIDKQSDMSVVSCVGDGRAAVQEAEKKRPAVAVVDLAMPVLNGFEATRQIATGPYPPRVLCLSGHADSQYLSAALSAGASGYLIKEHAAEELVRAIRTVSQGGTYLSPKVANEVVAGYVAYRKTTPDSSVLTGLTRREREVLQLIAEGQETVAIADRLGTSIKTVCTHREHLLRKLQVASVAELTRLAVREGVVGL
jgi:DNA-binding NarL/FixJ family response regulator